MTELGDTRWLTRLKTDSNKGTIEQVIGVVVDVVFPDGLPEIYSALKIEIPEGDGRKAIDLTLEVQQHLGDDRVRAVAMDATDGLRRGDAVIDTGSSITVPVGKDTLGRIFNLLGEPIDEGAPGRGRGSLADPPPGAERRGPDPDPGDPRDRHQGHRPARALRQGRQGRPVRRRRRRQDRPDPGADQQHRHRARRPLGLLRRRRADPRGQRPLRRDDRVGRHRQDDDGLRADERAPRGPPARRSDRPDDGGVLPRGRRPGRAPVHRQHLPVRAGGLRGFGAARADAVRGRLPADAGDRDGSAPGADHVDDPGIGHLDPGRLRPRRRPHRPGAGIGVRPPERDHDAVAVDLGEGHLPGRRSARLDLDDPQGRHPRRGALQDGDRRPGGAAALQGAAGHHRHPRHRRALRRGQAPGQPRPQDRALPEPAVQRRRAVHRQPRRGRPGRRDGGELPQPRRRRARRHPRGRLLHEGLDRAGPRRRQGPRRGRDRRRRRRGRRAGGEGGRRKKPGRPPDRWPTTRQRSGPRS